MIGSFAVGRLTVSLTLANLGLLLTLQPYSGQSVKATALEQLRTLQAVFRQTYCAQRPGRQITFTPGG